VSTSLIKKIRAKFVLYKAEAVLRKRNALGIFTPLGQVQNALKAARGVINTDDPLFEFVERQFVSFRLRRIATVIWMLLITLQIGTFLIFILPQNTRTQEIIPDLTLTSISPKYVSEGDKSKIEVTLVNLSTNQSFNGS